MTSLNATTYIGVNGDHLFFLSPNNGPVVYRGRTLCVELSPDY